MEGAEEGHGGRGQGLFRSIAELLHYAVLFLAFFPSMSSLSFVVYWC